MRALFAVLLLSASALAGCATSGFDPERWAAAAERHDKDCASKKKLDVVPMFIGIWPVPVFSFHYEAECPGKTDAP